MRKKPIAEGIRFNNSLGGCPRKAKVTEHIVKVLTFESMSEDDTDNKDQKKSRSNYVRFLGLGGLTLAVVMLWVSDFGPNFERDSEDLFEIETLEIKSFRDTDGKIKARGLGRSNLALTNGAITFGHIDKVEARQVGLKARAPVKIVQFDSSRYWPFETRNLVVEYEFVADKEGAFAFALDYFDNYGRKVASLDHYHQIVKAGGEPPTCAEIIESAVVSVDQGPLACPLE